MGFLDSLGDVVKKMGKAAIAGPGVVYDMATFMSPLDEPGDADNGNFGDLLNSISSRANDMKLAVPSPVRHGLGEVMHGAYVAYHEGVDQPLSTAAIMASQTGGAAFTGTKNFGDLFDTDKWKQAYALAEHQTFGESVIYGHFQGGLRPDAPLDMTLKPGETPFSTTLGDNAWAQGGAFGVDLVTSWYLDPFAVAGKVAGGYRQTHTLGKIPQALRGNFGEHVATQLDGSLSGLRKFRAIDWAGRFDDFFKHISTGGPDGRSLTAAEIRASSTELQKSSGGLAISSALEDALKLPEEADRINAARRVFAVAAGDTSQVARLRAEVAGGEALADKLSNILSQKTLDLQAQALNAARKDSPEFRAAFDRQIANLDADGDLTKAIQAWRKNVVGDLSTKGGLLSTERTLDYMPTYHRIGSAHGLKVARGENVLSKIEKGHDATVKKIERLLPERDSFGSIYQRGLFTLPVLAIYPAKFVAATLPTKAVPALVRGLRTVHFTGVVNLHDWDAASDQLNSMMIHAGVENETRIRHLSDVYKANTEMERRAVIDRVEQVAVDGIAKQVSAKYGIDIDRDYVQQAMLYGQQRRGSSLNAMLGSRQYSATEMPADMAARARSIANIRTADRIASKRAGELDRRGLLTEAEQETDNWKLRVDQFIDESGVPVSLPLDTSQLVNHIPLLDVHMVKQMTSDKAFVDRLKSHADAWRDASTEMRGLEGEMARATGANIARVQRRIENLRRVQDQLLNTASLFNRVWKAGVLFRLGYPMRVLADDHMRIAARIGYMPFLLANVPEGALNSYYNYMPRFLPGTRKAEAVKQLRIDENNRAAYVAHYGRSKAHTDREWADLTKAIKTYNGNSAPEAELRAARRVIDRLDPEGKITQHYDLLQQAKTLKDEGALAQVQEQLAGKIHPEELRKRIIDLDKRIREGGKSYRAPKRTIGDTSVKLGDGNVVPGAFAGPAGALREATSSSPGFTYQMTDGEEINFRLHSSGHWRTVRPGEPGYYQLWANVLNHQFQHGPGFMAIIKGEVKNLDDFAKWLHKPEQRHIIDRVGHYARDPQDYGGRLFAMVEDYLPTQEVRDLVANGRVSAQQLQKMFGERDPRLPNLHGSLADVQSGRTGVVQATWEGYQRVFRYLSEVPTDRLSRHPFFNAIYKREVKQAYAGIKMTKGAENFTQEDANLIASIARKKALGELKQTLWDISAHSHAAHVLRFLSPFFAAHQEALNRWWNIAKDDPSVVRKFQMAFDAPRKAGMTYNEDTGEVLPGDAIGGPGNKIMLRLPFAGDNNSINRWLKEHGGGKYWSVNESGFNLILQNGILNPGVGPLVTIPMESLVQKYPQASEFERAARALNQYPPPPGSGHRIAGVIDTGVALNATIPAWSKHMLAAFQGESSAEFGSLFAQNFADELVRWNQTHDRPPSEVEKDGLLDKVNKRTHADLLMESATNLLWITPGKPNSGIADPHVTVKTGSRYALVQQGLQKLYEQMRTQGKDMDWLRQTFWQQYGDVYMPLVYSTGTNPAGLDSNVAEASAIMRRSSVLKHVDPSLTRMVIGPDVAGAPDEHKMYSSAVSSWLTMQETGTPGENYRGKKDPRDAASDLIAQQGWDQYDQLINALDVMAEQQGLAGYEQSAQLVNAKRAGVDWIKQQNPVWAHLYEDPRTGSYDKLVDDMRQIASSRELQSDPFRANDIYWLGQYVVLRDAVRQMLASRAAAGGDKTIGAQSNADLARMFAAGVQYINTQSPYFKQYSYPTIEHDPMLVASAQLVVAP